MTDHTLLYEQSAEGWRVWCSCGWETTGARGELVAMLEATGDDHGAARLVSGTAPSPSPPGPGAGP